MSNESASNTGRPKKAKPALIFHPFLFAVFPLLSMLSSNIGEALPREVFLPGAAVLLVAAIFWFTLAPVLPGKHKRALALSLLWIPFYAFGPAIDALRSATDFREMLSPLQCIIVLLVVCGACIPPLYKLRRSARHFEKATGPLNILAACVVIVALAGTGQRLYEQRQYRLPLTAQEAGIVNPDIDRASLPDIYYVVFDAYTRADYMQAVFDHDNSEFLDALRQRGFYVADKSRSNYILTQMSLASSLNFEHIDADLRQLATDDWDAAVAILAQKIWDNRAVKLLKDHGYEFVAFASGVRATSIPGADRYIEPPKDRVTEFQRRFIERTPLRLILNRIARPRRSHRVVFVLDELAKLKRRDAPMFVFAHIMAPHLPHSLDADGNALDKAPPYLQGYRDEVVYLNKRTLEWVDAQKARNPNSVFILQGDHGPWSNWRDDHNRYVPPWEGTWEDYVHDRTAILNAYHLPGAEYEGLLYPQITPVNTFRILFNTYFGTQYELVEDVSYVYTDDNDIVPVAETP